MGKHSRLGRPRLAIRNKAGALLNRTTDPAEALSIILDTDMRVTNEERVRLTPEQFQALSEASVSRAK